MAHTAWAMASSTHSTYSSNKAKQAEAEAEAEPTSNHKPTEGDAENRFQNVPLERHASTASQSPLLPSGVGQSLADRFAGVGKGLGGFGSGKRAEERVGVKISRPMESLPRMSFLSGYWGLEIGSEARQGVFRR